LVYNLTNFPNLLIRFPDFFYDTLNMTWTTHPLMHVHTSHQPYGYPPFMLCSWQQAHMNPWCSLWHLCCHCVWCWLPHGAKTTPCASFKHIQFFLSMNQHCVHQKWHSHPS
jgi:hypothetical protein